MSVTGAGIYKALTKRLGQVNAKLGNCRLGWDQDKQGLINRVVPNPKEIRTNLFMIQLLAGLTPIPGSEAVSPDHQALVFIALADLAFAQSQREDVGLVFCPGLEKAGIEVAAVKVSEIETEPNQTPAQLREEWEAFFSGISLAIKPSNWTLINLLQNNQLILEVSVVAAQIANTLAT